MRNRRRSGRRRAESSIEISQVTREQAIARVIIVQVDCAQGILIGMQN